VNAWAMALAIPLAMLPLNSPDASTVVSRWTANRSLPPG
jgi:hypothetical protein